MPSLTPHRDAVAKGLAEAGRQLAAIETGPVGTIEKRMSLGVMEATMLGAAELVDLGCSSDTIERTVESAFANTLMSHAMNLAGGDPGDAQQRVPELIARILGLTIARLVTACPDIRVSIAPEPSPTGHA